ncbi:Zeta toxin domain-containing protein [Madurella fahalii]|uniref:Zeta toxin domain-containing protein n=1 Tax=Madurella fahalii TaxID=1157608 RepID=A0ABQ0G5U0_9PEZI
MSCDNILESGPHLPRRRLFIQMSGAPGSGKSTTAELLGQALHAVVIDHDIIKSTLLDDDSGISFEQAAKSAYRLDWALAEATMKQGWSVIIDSTCNFKEILDQGTKLAGLYGHEYWYIECRVRVSDMVMLDERLRGRVPLRSQRAGVDLAPVDVNVVDDGAGSRAGEDSRELFRRWIENPCRPDGEASVYVVAVDSTASPMERRDCVLERMRLLNSSPSFP